MAQRAPRTPRAAKGGGENAVRRPTGRKVDVGLDLTSNELRCVAITRKGKEVVLERFAVGEIPTSVFAAGRVSEPAQLGARIRQVLAENGINPRRAIMSLSGKAAITRIIELPKMGAAQTRQAISLQINQYVPFPPGDTVYDYKVLPPREGGNPAMQEVLLVATRASTVDSLIQTLRAAGIEPDPELFAGSDFSLQGGYLAAKQLLGRPHNKPTAIFAASDEMAIGAILAARDLGLTVPHDLSVIGIDDHELAEFFGVTTIAQFPALQGRMAVDILMDVLNPGHREPVASNTSLPYELIVRSSTARPVTPRE